MTIKLPKDFVDKCNRAASNSHAKEAKPKMQTCSCCGIEKPLDEFYKQSITGLPTGQCKTCINVKRSVVRHKAKHGKFISKERQRSMDEPNYSLDDWRDAMIHFGGQCPICGKVEGRAKKAKFDRDHIVPLSKGGKTVRSNIMPCCPTCNRGRGNKEMFEWFRQQPTWTREREMKIREWMYQEV